MELCCLLLNSALSDFFLSPCDRCTFCHIWLEFLNNVRKIPEYWFCDSILWFTNFIILGNPLWFQTMSHAAYVYDIAHVIVDNLQFMMGLSSSQVEDR